MSTLNFFLVALILLVSVETAYANTMPSSSDSNTGWYQFDSLPQGEVIFDGISYGKTPVFIPVNPKADPNHNYVIKIVGYEDYSRQLKENPQSGETISVTLDMNIFFTDRNLFSCENN